MKRILIMVLFFLITIQCFSQDRPTGLMKPNNWQSQVEKDESKPPISIMSQVPPRWDWREKEMVTPVRDQGWCGSCWAFGTISSMESAILINNGIEVDLSEQWLIDTSRNGSCNGGWVSFNRFYDEYDKCYFIDKSENKKTIDWTGAVLEQDYPYTGIQGGCPGYNPIRYFRTKGQIFFGYKGDGQPIDYNEIKYGLYHFGPLAAEVVAKDEFNSYHGGILSGGEEYTEEDINHMICIVGYDDTATTPYLIVKNSWGTGWGEKGFGKIAYGSFMVGFDAVAPIYDEKGPLFPLPESTPTPTPRPTPTPTPVPTPIPPMDEVLSNDLNLEIVTDYWDSKWITDEEKWVAAKKEGYNGSLLKTKISDNPGTFSFNWKGAGTESLGDKYSFLVNGVEETNYNFNNNGWVRESIYLPENATVSWVTTRTLIVAINRNFEAYLDDFTFSPQEKIKTPEWDNKDILAKYGLILAIAIVGLLIILSIYYNK